MERLFVYGTLKRGHCNHHVLQATEAKFEGKARIFGRIYNLGMFPGLKSKEGGTVYGEIYKINEDQLNTIDWFEGEPNLYKRIKVGSNQGEVWTYEYVGPFDDEEHIKSGNWK